MALIVGGVTLTGTQVLDATKLSGNLPAISGASLTNLPAPSAANVGSGMAGLEVDQVGATMIGVTSVVPQTQNATMAGSSLFPANCAGSNGPSSVSGTYRIMGIMQSPNSTGQRVTTVKRIS